jgi:hypothetical protein
MWIKTAPAAGQKICRCARPEFRATFGNRPFQRFARWSLIACAARDGREIGCAGSWPKIARILCFLREQPGSENTIAASH